MEPTKDDLLEFVDKALDSGSKYHEPIKKTIIINFEIDVKFISIIPSINLNFHDMFVFEFEWLCFGIYIKF